MDGKMSEMSWGRRIQNQTRGEGTLSTKESSKDFAPWMILQPLIKTLISTFLKLGPSFFFKEKGPWGFPRPGASARSLRAVRALGSDCCVEHVLFGCRGAFQGLQRCVFFVYGNVWDSQSWNISWTSNFEWFMMLFYNFSEKGDGLFILGLLH